MQQKGVKVADLQHGVIAESHPWYGAKWRGLEPDNWSPNYLVWDKTVSKRSE